MEAYAISREQKLPVALRPRSRQLRDKDRALDVFASRVMDLEPETPAIPAVNEASPNAREPGASHRSGDRAFQSLLLVCSYEGVPKRAKV